MPIGRVGQGEAVDFARFALDDLEDAVILDASESLLRLEIDVDTVLELDGSFQYDAPGTLPVSGEITGGRLIAAGETVFSLSGVSLDVESLLALMEDDDQDEEAEDAAEALFEPFDIDPFSEGVVTLSEADAFEVSYDGGEEVARFEGSFVYGPEGGLPVSGEITAFTLTEDGEEELSLDALSVDVADLVAASALLAELDGGDGPPPWAGGPPSWAGGPPPWAGGGRGRPDPEETEAAEAADDAVFDLLEGLLSGSDRLVGRGLADRILGELGDDRLRGRGGDDALDGGAGRDRLDGDAGADHLHGGGGRDRLLGDAGDDLLDGGLGRDVMRGGAGADVFLFDSLEDSGRGKRKDLIRDFAPGEDVIDLAGIDADTTQDGDQAFTLVGRRFSDTPGELALRGSTLRGDVDGDGRADFMIVVAGRPGLEEDDFIL